MKRFLIVLLALAAFAFADADSTLVQDSSKTQVRQYPDLNLFLDFSADFRCLGYSASSDPDYSDWNHDDITDDADGCGFGGGFKVGGMTTSNVAFHVGVDLAFIDADRHRVKNRSNGYKTDKEGQVDLTYAFVSVGITVYPDFDSTSFWRGSFVGVSIGASSLKMGDDDYFSSRISMSGLGIKLEAGKEWYVTNHWLLGVGTSFMLGGSTGGEFDENAYTLSAGLKVSRR